MGDAEMKLYANIMQSRPYGWSTLNVGDTRVIFIVGKIRPAFGT